VTPRPRHAGPSGFLFTSLLLAAVVGAGVCLDRTAAVGPSPAGSADRLARELALEVRSPEARSVAAWVIASNDHAGRPFLIIDQARARLFAFSSQGHLVGSASVVRQVAWADPPAPSGRFVADGRGSEPAGTIVWADAHRAVSLRVATASEAEPPRLLASADGPAGSFQVAPAFYRRHLHAFRHQASVAYLLPDTLPLQRNFMLYAAASIRDPGRFI
jgi:hypothetical protein